MGTGLLVTSMIGSTINPTTGDYSRGAAGFWVENGELAYPVHECTIAGNLRDMLLRLVPANEGIAFPTGTMDTFTTYGGPANLLETANTIGLPLYARQHLDPKGRWIDLMTEASILPVNKRPRLAIRLHSSN